MPSATACPPPVKTTAQTVAAGLAAEDAAAEDFARRHFTQAEAEAVYLGKTVRTSYGSGPYLVTAVAAPCTCVKYLASLEGDKTSSESHVHLVCREDGDTKDSYLGGYRLDGTNVWSDDTLTILGEPLVPELGQLIADHPDGFAAGNGIPLEQMSPCSHIPGAVEGRVKVRVGDQLLTCFLSPAYEGIPDWRGTPEFERLTASAVRDRKFQQRVLGRVVTNHANGQEEFEIEDGRHRFFAASAAHLPSIEGELTEMPVNELMVRSLCERLHMSKGARAYLVWPLLAPELEAAKTARVARNKGNLVAGAKQKKEKGALSNSSLSEEFEKTDLQEISNAPLSEANHRNLAHLAEIYGLGLTLLDQARRVHEIFARRKDLKAENEAAILAGDLGMGAFLAGVAGKEATEGKKRAETTPADLLRRSFRDLRIRFAADRWNAVPDTDRTAVAGELVETVLDLPADVRAKLKLALA
jgi:hypothetical protein